MANYGNVHGGSRRSRNTPLPPLPMHVQHHHHQQQHPQPMRTPNAWQLRDVNLSRPVSTLAHHANGGGHYGVAQSSIAMHHNHRYPPTIPLHMQQESNRPSSSATTSSDDREEVPMVRSQRRPNRYGMLLILVLLGLVRSNVTCAP